MALLGEIRKRSWLLIVGITVPMLGFLLMDMSGPQGSSLFGGGTNVGKINGKSISIQDFQNRLSARNNSGVDGNENNENVWNDLVNEHIINSEANAMGFDVKGEEIVELMSGTNMSPVIQQAFFNPQTRQVDVQQAKQFYDDFRNGNADPNIARQMALMEDQVIYTQKATKFSSLVGQSLYTPKWLAEAEQTNQTQTANVSYVQVPFNEITGAAAPTDAELDAYLKDNAWKYENKEETRTVKYVSFDIKATSKDSADIRKNMAKLSEEFGQEENNASFVQKNYGSYDTRYVTKDEVDAKIADDLFSAAPGTVVGPYLDDAGYYRITKLVDRTTVPDSVKSRHILRTVDANDGNGRIAARKTLDSLKTLLVRGTANFDSLAFYFGQDGTRATGGDLGYSGPIGLVSEYRDLIFYDARKGDYNVVETQFGVHLVQVTGIKSSGKTGVRVATIGEYIAPSESTQKAGYTRALEFVRDNRTLETMRQSALKEGLELKTASGLKINDYKTSDLESSDDTRKMVKFAYEAKPGSVSPDIYTYTEEGEEIYDKAYVVAALSTINPPGLPTVEAVRDQISQAVLNNKKGEVLASKVSGNDLAAIATQYSGATTRDSLSVNFATGIFNEPKVTAALRNMGANQTSKPIVGNGGVYIVQMHNKASNPASDISAVQTGVDRQVRQKMIQSGQLMKSLKDASDVKDTRHFFY